MTYFLLQGSHLDLPLIFKLFLFGGILGQIMRGRIRSLAARLVVEGVASLYVIVLMLLFGMSALVPGLQTFPIVVLSAEGINAIHAARRRRVQTV